MKGLYEPAPLDELVDIEQRVIGQVIGELHRAADKHPKWPDDVIHQAAIVQEESGELMRAAVQGVYEDGKAEEILKEACQTAAVAIRLMIYANEKMRRG